MKVKLPRIPRPSWPRRKPRAEVPPPAPVSGPLRAFRAAALWGLAVLVAVADGSAFTESYRGLFEWAGHHGLAGFWAAAFPGQVDTFIVAGEVVLFIAMTDRWSRRDRAGAWAVALLGLAVSVAGNVGHVAAHDLQSRGTAAVPPVAAFGALWLGLGVLKRVLRHRGDDAAGTASSARDSAERDALAETIAALADAVRALADRDGSTVSSPVPHPGETALLSELLEAVRSLGERTGGTEPPAVPADAESAALTAMRATVAAGNPLSVNQLCERFSLTRSQATKIRRDAGTVPPARGGTPDATAAEPVPPLRRLGDGQPAPDFHVGRATLNGSFAGREAGANQ